MNSALSNARHSGESFTNYKARLKLAGRQVDAQLRGRIAHASTQVVQLPPFGTDTKSDQAVLAGYYRDIQQVFLPGGKEINIALTKGVTYRNPDRAVRGLRSYWRELRAVRKARAKDLFLPNPGKRDWAMSGVF
jgi:hypothetical protein